MNLAPVGLIDCGRGNAVPLPAGPHALAVDDQDRLYAAFERVVQVVDSAGHVVHQIAAPRRLTCMAIAADRLWLAMPGEIRIFTLRGEPVGRFADLGALGEITALVVGPHTITAADAGDRALCRFDRQGEFLGATGDEVNRRGFLIPNGQLSAAAAPDGETFWVAHPGKHRVEQYRMTGEFCQKFGRFGNANPADFTGCCNPTNAAVASSGDVLVTEKAPPRLKVFRPDGELLASTEPGIFDPLGKNLAVVADSRGTIYVADPPRRQIQIFALPALKARETVG